MKLSTWIRQNRELIDRVIHANVDPAFINDDERRLWVINHEPLYLIAFDAGVDI